MSRWKSLRAVCINYLNRVRHCVAPGHPGVVYAPWEPQRFAMLSSTLANFDYVDKSVLNQLFSYVQMLTRLM